MASQGNSASRLAQMQVGSIVDFLFFYRNILFIVLFIYYCCYYYDSRYMVIVIHLMNVIYLIFCEQYYKIYEGVLK